MFKSEEFEKRQLVAEKVEALKGKKGMEFAKAKMELLQFCKDENIDENIGRLVDIKDMDEINLTDDISFKNVHLVTRELEVGDRGDSFEVYELYDKDGNLLLKTDEDRNIIAEPILKEMYTKEQIEELQSKVMIRMTKEINDRGDKKQFIAISDKLGKDQMLSQEDMDKVRDNTIYNELEDDEKQKENIDEKVEKEELSEEQIEEKVGGHIVDIIEDPNFYQIIPFAKYRTYLVEEGGQYKFVDGQGNEIKGMQEESRQVFVDDEQTKSIQEKQMSDMVFSTGRNDDGIVIAIKDGKIHLVDPRKDISDQLGTLGHNVTEQEQLETRENITERDDLTGTDVTMDFLNDLVNREDIELSERDIRDLYETCQNKHLMRSDIEEIKEEARQREARERNDRDIGEEYEERREEEMRRAAMRRGQV